MFDLLDTPQDKTADMVEMILTYVPEAEFVDFVEAFALAVIRDQQAAEEFAWSVEYV